MAKNPDTEKIISYLRENQKDTILSSAIYKISTLNKNIKDDAIEYLGISNDIWKSNREHISSYMRALFAIEYLKVENTDIYNSLFNCKNKNEVVTLISGKLPEGYSDSHNVCKHIISEIKYLKKRNHNSSYQETQLSSAINANNLETNEAIENTLISEQSVEHTNSSSNLKNNPNESIPNEKVSIKVKDLNKLINDDKEFFKKIINISDDEIEKTLLEKFKDNYNMSSELVEEWIDSYKKQISITLEENKPIKELAILKESDAEEIKNLHIKINELISEVSHFKDDNTTLTSQLIDVNKQLENYKSKTPNLSSKHVFSVELKELNSMLNSNSSESQIAVKDEILNKVSKYIDEYSLIKIEDIINKNRDLKSEMVQIILLAFLHEKSLLWCYIKRLTCPYL